MQLPPTAADLTDALRKSGALGSAAVCDVTVELDRNTLLSRIMRLRLSYQGVPSGAPRTVFLKTGLSGPVNPVWNAGRQEVAFYTDAASEFPPGIVPRCFDACFDAETNAWHLLLEDLAETHTLATQWPLPPTQPQCETIMAAAARFHAAWWDDDRLGVSIGRWLDAEGFAQYRQKMDERYRQFTDRLGDLLPASRRDLYDRFLADVPRLYRRIQSHRNVTMVHGDAHVWNFFLPRDGGQDVRIFDWDGWRPSLATMDLAYMMAVHWYPDRRRQMEKPLLDHYHEVLMQHGVHGYDRRTLEDDYRFSVLAHIMVPVWQSSANIPPVVWWNNMERVLLAVDDLGCRDLLS
jgi:thiamine kinase-like enzyme